MTPNQLHRVSAEWDKVAGENLAFEEIGGVFYAFGTELATLRLLKFYRDCGDKVKAGYSENTLRHYFRLEF